jgi:hypothetical protein
MVEQGKVSRGQGKQEGLEDDDCFPQTRIHVIMQIVQPKPGGVRSEMQSVAKLLSFAMELLSESESDCSKDVELVEKTSPAAKENHVHELIPLGILARQFALIEGGIERGNGGRDRKLTSPPLHDAAGRSEWRGKIGYESGSDLDTLTCARKLAFGVKSYGIIERDRENSIRVLPFVDDGLKDAALVVGEACTPIFSYGVTRNRRLPLSSPKQGVHLWGGIIPEEASAERLLKG